MNTDRDNFYDWAKDKPDTTSYAGLDRPAMRYRSVQGDMPWGRIGSFIMVAVAAIAVLKLYVL